MTEIHYFNDEVFPMEGLNAICLRYNVQVGDSKRIRRLTTSTGFFNQEEINVAVELVEDRLAKGPASGYFFIFAEHNGDLAGYTCFGPIACTDNSFDLYWIAVHPDFQHRGIGHRLVQDTERHVRKMGGERIYIDTSQRIQYAGTRAFYESCGYKLEALLPDFYRPGDGKVIFCKHLEG